MTVAHPPAARTSDTGSLAMVMLLTLVGTMLSALLVPVVLTQITGSRRDVQRIRSLDAARSGVDVALAHIWAASDSTGAGVIASLPCGPFSGNVGGGGRAQYQVTVDYLPTDPQGQSDAWITANRIQCVAGSGTLSTPAYALVRAQGTDGTSQGSRTLQGTFAFRTTNQNIAGGLLHVYKTATSTDLCMDAGSATPAAGTNLQMRPCSAGSRQQTFAYNTNLTLSLTSSKTSALPLGMCLDAGTPQAAGSLVKFQPCATPTRPQQQWSFNDASSFMGTSDGRTTNSYCFNVQTPNTSGSLVVLGTGSSCNNGSSTTDTFQPEATVGAGAAGAAANQVVNFKQFGRCLDVPNFDVTYAYMIIWPCKQAPDPTTVGWNQKWTLPAIPAGASSASGRITVNPSSTLYCLKSTGSIGAGHYPTLAACPSGSTPSNMTWTVYGETGVYETGYRIKDSSGNCLSPTDPTASPPDLYSAGQQISKLVLVACGGSTLQKWNAPASVLRSQPLKDINEK